MRTQTAGHLVLFGFWMTLTPSTFAAEPVIGGPCEGCEHVFEGKPDAPGSHSTIAPRTAKGNRLIVEGTVTTLKGEPAQGIWVYAYHTDQQGIYPAGRTPHGTLRGWARTDRAGKYRFDTIRPGPYPGRKTPQHIHMHVIEPGRGTYYIADIVFRDDPRLDAKYLKRSPRGGSGLTFPKRDAKGIWRVQRDITLGLNIPGY